VVAGAVQSVFVDGGVHVEGGRGKEAGVVDEGVEEGAERARLHAEV